MQLASTAKSDISVGFAEKGSTIFGYLKPFIQVAVAGLTMYLLDDDGWSKKDWLQVLIIFSGAFGLESINVAPRTDRVFRTTMNQPKPPAA
jgi:hypothetical protein